jgi:hypothetical protein
MTGGLSMSVAAKETGHRENVLSNGLPPHWILKTLFCLTGQ